MCRLSCTWCNFMLVHLDLYRDAKQYTLHCTLHTAQVCDLEQAHQGPKVSDMLHYGDVAHMAPELVSEGHLTEVRQPRCV